MSEKKRILITVKTYPNISTKYSELVCTAGITESGEWIRLYPIPFRLMDYEKRYKKYQWIEVEVEKNNEDYRPESYRPINYDQIKVGEIIDTKRNWEVRKDKVLKNVYYDLEKLIADAKDNKKSTSLAVFKPTKILAFETKEEQSKEFSKRQIERIEQGRLFLGENPFKSLKKLPYRFYYRFEDCKRKQSRLMIEDWEIGQLYWNCLKRKKSYELACEDVRKKYWDDFVTNKDLYLFLGTTLRWHRRAPNPFIIIGVFYPKKE